MKIMARKDALKLLNKLNKQTIETDLDIIEEIKQDTLRVALPFKLHKEVSLLCENYYYNYSFIKSIKKGVSSKKDYIKVKNYLRDYDKNQVDFSFKIKKQDLLLFSSAHFVAFEEQLPLGVPLIVHLFGYDKDNSIDNKDCDLIIVKMENNKQEIYTLDNKKWEGSIDNICSYKSVY